MSIFTAELVPWLQEVLSLEPKEMTALGPSRNPQAADFTLPAFVAAKRLGVNPAQAASRWAKLLQERSDRPRLVASFEPTGPYLNFQLDAAAASERLLPVILANPGRWGYAEHPLNERVCIDFSSPNIAKPFAIHHLRSTLIGAVIANLLESQGYRVERINHLGDWGTQFGYVMLSWKKFHGKDDLGTHPLKTLVELYQRIMAEAKAQESQGDTSLHTEAAAWFRRLEDGDPEARRLWSWFRDVSVKELEELYKRMGIAFDAYRGEAHYEDVLDKIIDFVQDKGLLVESEGAQIIELGEDMPPLLLRKSDGATLYATRDLAALFDRWERGSFTFNLYIVASQQHLHFKQLFAAVEKLGHPSAGRNQHIPFGMLRMPDGTLGKTRAGNVIYLDEVLDMAREKARERLTANISSEISPGDLDRLAEEIGLGAVYFNDLKAQRVKDVTFKWEDVLQFEGRTGAYLQYAQARMNRILEKGGWDPATPFEPAQLIHPREKELVLSLERFPDAVAQAALQFEPNLLVNYLFDMVQVYSRLTQDKEGGVRILTEDNTLRQARLSLVAATRATVVQGLKFLCLPCPERM